MAELYPDVNKNIIAQAIKRMVDSNTLPQNAVISPEAWKQAVALRHRMGDLKSLNNKIIFMLAAKTYMYLPLFLAKEKGIFKSVFEAKRIKDDIEFRICDGDDDAIDSMLDFNRNARKCKLDEIAIAISDPTSILRQHKSFDNKTDIKVIGKLINKLPFWVICPYNEELMGLWILRN